MAARGIRVARPIRSLAGRTLESVPTPMGAFHGVLFEALAGEHRELDDLGADDLARWGRALAEVHNAGEGLEIGSRPDWTDHLVMARQAIPCSEAEAWAELDAIGGQLRTLLLSGLLLCFLTEQP